MRLSDVRNAWICPLVFVVSSLSMGCLNPPSTEGLGCRGPERDCDSGQLCIVDESDVDRPTPTGTCRGTCSSSDDCSDGMVCAAYNIVIEHPVVDDPIPGGVPPDGVTDTGYCVSPEDLDEQGIVFGEGSPSGEGGGSVDTDSGAGSGDGCMPDAPAGAVALFLAENDTRDAVGGNDGVALGNVRFVDGVRDGCFAFQFDGDGASVFVDSLPTLPTGNLPRTIAFWLRVESLQHNREIVGWGIDSVGQKSAVSMRTDPFPTVFFWGYANDLSMVDSPPVGTWFHVAFTFDGATGTLYLDGTENATAAMTLDSVASPFVIGGGPNGSVAGSVDDVALYNRALSTSEIRNLATR